MATQTNDGQADLTSGATASSGSGSGRGRPKQDTSVSSRVTGLMSKNNPLMKQARTQGKQQSNRRGLMNSSMGVQAGQAAAYEQAVPIASQEAQQAHQLQLKGIDAATAERQQASQLASSFENSYASMVSNITQNPELPKGARERYLRHAAQTRDSNLAMVEQMYGIELDWGTPMGEGAGGQIQNYIDQSEQIVGLEDQLGSLRERLNEQQSTINEYESQGSNTSGGSDSGTGPRGGGGHGGASSGRTTGGRR